MARKKSKLESTLTWMVRKMGIPDAVREFKKKGRGDDPGPVDPDADSAMVIQVMRSIARKVLAFRQRYGSFPGALRDVTRRRAAEARDALLGEQDPADPNSDPANAPLVPTREHDYVYLPPAEGADDDMILLYEPVEHHDDKGTNVTLISGQVLWLDKANFQKHLQRTLAHNERVRQENKKWHEDD